MAHLYFMWKEPGREDRILVWDTQTISVGRAAENDIVPDDDEVSRKHAHLEKTGDGLRVGDYRTGNGTFVNGERVKQHAPIKPGDVIGIGKLELTLQQSEEHPAKLGLRLEFASQLKTVGMIPGGTDAGATMLGLGDTGPPMDDFVVEPERGSGQSAFVAGDGRGGEFQMKELEEGDFAPSPVDMGGELELELDDGLGPSDASDIPPPPETRPLELDLEPAAPAAPQPAPAAAAAPARKAGGDPSERLRKLKVLHDEGLISDEEFEEKRSQILAEM